MKTTTQSESCCGPSRNAGKSESAASGACCSGSGAITDAASGSCCDSRSEKSPQTVGQARNRQLIVDYLYIDLSVCERCQDTEAVLEEALAEMSGVLAATGIEVILNKIHVSSEPQASELGFLVSPTVRVDGRDIQMNFRESLCDTCGTLCDCEGGVSCREWEYQGEWYTAPPKGLIIESVLRLVYDGDGSEQRQPGETGATSDNLKKFFSGRRTRENPGSAEN